MFYSPTIWDVIFMLFFLPTWHIEGIKKFFLKKARSSAVTHLASATPNMQPPTVDQKPIQPAPTCALGGAMEGKVKKKRREGQRRGERRGGYWCLKCSP